MDDLTRIQTEISKQEQAEKQVIENRRETQILDNSLSESNLKCLHTRLKVFERSVGSRVSVNMAVNDVETALEIRIGSKFPLLSEPAYRFKITATPTLFNMAGQEDTKFSECGLSIDEIVDRLSKFVASEIQSPRPYRLPKWFVGWLENVAVAITMITSIGTWIFVGLAGGMWGWLLGWIPALIVASITIRIWAAFTEES